MNNTDPSYHTVAEEISILKDEQEKVLEYRTKGAIIRSKTQWYNEGEKNSSHFLNLEKRHFKQGTIRQLKVTESDFVTSDQDILSECETFFKNLYSPRTQEGHDSTFFSQANFTSLTTEEQNTCEGALSQKECLEALKNMDSNKTPGTDGLPAEFYKVFWKDICPFLVSALNYAFDSGCLSVTQRRGIIKLIPKKDGEPYYIKNWRPITLLNTDYKIAAKAIAIGMKQVLPSLIIYDQTGFLKGRFIGENFRLIDCIIQCARGKKIQAYFFLLILKRLLILLNGHLY